MTFEELVSQFREQQSFEYILEHEGELKYHNTGISMSPLLRQNRDILIIKKPEGRLHLWDVPLFKRKNAPRNLTYVMHRVLWAGRHSYVMCGDNQWRPEFGVQDSQILGVLDAVERRSADGKLEKVIPVRSTPEHPHVPLLYRAYVFLWCFFFPIRAVIVYLEYRYLFWQRRHASKKHSQ